MADLTEEQRAAAAARERHAYRRITVWAASGALVVAVIGAYLLGARHRAATEIPTLRDDYRPAAPVTVICGRQGDTP